MIQFGFYLESDRPMKWYTGLNEAGTEGASGFHLKLAVLSAKRMTSLIPKIVYHGQRNHFTKWLEDHGVEIFDYQLPFTDLIESLARDKRYSRHLVGHWLRTAICHIEKEDEHVLYTDVDVFFQRSPEVEIIHPELFSAAPEFRINFWNYFNSGVMVMNVERLREDYHAFESWIRRRLEERGFAFMDQNAYNEFYRARWEKLDPLFNWKPYWGANPDARIVHFHGPKIDAIESIINGRWDWSSVPGLEIGSLLVANVASYRSFVGSLLSVADELSTEEADRLVQLSTNLNQYAPSPDQKTDLAFMNYRMFPDE